MSDSFNIQPGFDVGAHDTDFVGMPEPWWEEPVTLDSPEWPEWLSKEPIF